MNVFIRQLLIVVITFGLFESLAIAETSKELRKLRKRVITLEQDLAELSEKTNLEAADVLPGRWQGTLTWDNPNYTIKRVEFTCELEKVSVDLGNWSSQDNNMFYYSEDLGVWTGHYRIQGNNLVAYDFHSPIRGDRPDKYPYEIDIKDTDTVFFYQGYNRETVIELHRISG